MKRKSIREVIENPQPNEYYVLVTRFYPMELRKRSLSLVESPIDVWDRNLAPSKELLRDVKNLAVTWKEYDRAFRIEVPKDLALKTLKQHKENANGKEVVLVCVEEESDYPKCHTWILLGYYEWIMGMAYRDDVRQ